MQGKKHPMSCAVSESAAQAVLRRSGVPGLAPDEERLLRMRLGAGLPLSARLERIATASDDDIELMALEIETYCKLRERGALAERPSPAPRPSRTKEKIIRALRKTR
jgi:hypothetical protein